MATMAETAPKDLRAELLRVLVDREVQCVQTKVWDQNELDKVPTGHPIAPTGGTPADRVLDAAGVDDLQTEIDYLRQRLDQLMSRLPHSTGKPVVPVERARGVDVAGAMRRIGQKPEDFTG